MYPGSGTQTICWAFDFIEAPGLLLQSSAEELMTRLQLNLDEIRYSFKGSSRLYENRYSYNNIDRLLSDENLEVLYILSREKCELSLLYEARQCIAFDFRNGTSRILVYHTTERVDWLESDDVLAVIGGPEYVLFAYSYYFPLELSPLLYFIGVSYSSNRRNASVYSRVEEERVASWGRRSLNNIERRKPRDIYPIMRLRADVAITWSRRCEQLKLINTGGSNTSLMGECLVKVQQSDFAKARECADRAGLTMSHDPPKMRMS